MNYNLLKIQSPAFESAEAQKGPYKLEFHGLKHLHKVYWNLPNTALYEEAVFRGEGIISNDGALVAATGKNTHQAVNDRCIVKTPANQEKIWWGEHNRPFGEKSFELIYNRVKAYLQGRDVFVQDCYSSTDPEHRLPVRVITETAWHSLFARNMFFRAENIPEFIPEFTIIHVPHFFGVPEVDSTRSDTFILINFDQKVCLIGGTGYGGDIKKAVFTVMNYLLSYKNVLTMHCSANSGSNGDTALFFGFSGTGKTALAVDPTRSLIGDDVLGWGDDGIFNLEGGCYARAIALTDESEPQILAATKRFGAILENVVCDPITRRPDFSDTSITNNARAAYPLQYIDNAVADGRGGHPRNIIMLTCDASGVLPPLARLTHEQAMYYFISGYTSKVAAGDTGKGPEPEVMFSACCGAPFMVHHPYKYAEMLHDKIARYDARCWLINTGWIGGPYGTGKRMSIPNARKLLYAALDGSLDKVEYYTDPVFGLEIPKAVPGLPENFMQPEKSWPDSQAFYRRRDKLALLFNENFEKFKSGTPAKIVNAGPKRP
ncbi:MAG: phosphoenolpyruvate carboxykinase (ATP) [Candidatus Zixiibacteriota bacterium]